MTDLDEQFLIGWARVPEHVEEWLREHDGEPLPKSIWDVLTNCQVLVWASSDADGRYWTIQPWEWAKIRAALGSD